MESTFHTEVRIPKGIDIIGPVDDTGPEIEKCTGSNRQKTKNKADYQKCWSYLFVHNNKVGTFTDRLRRDGVRHFIHKSVTYQRKKHTKGIQAIERPTVSGLIFLQGTPRRLQRYLDFEFPNYHLVNDCSTHRPAVIPDPVMQPFMRVLEISPERVRFLLRPFRYYAGGNVKLRITSGFLAGLEGYVIRIDRDRRLVMDVGGMSVAIAGVHCEKFEVVAEERKQPPPRISAQAVETTQERHLTELQARIDRDLYIPRTRQEVNLIAETLDLWRERAAIYQEKWQISEATEILFFLLEEIDYHYSTLLSSKSPDPSPILSAARLISTQIDAMTTDPKLSEETRQEITSERDGSLAKFGYLFGE